MKQLSQPLLQRLYIRERCSSVQIAEKLRCSPHKINYWLSKFHIPKRSISEAVYQKHNPNGDPFQIKIASNVADAKLFGLGLGLYWGEGNKKNKNSIRLGNVDPALLRTFIEFLVRILGVQEQKLRFGLQIFTDISEKAAIRFWLQELRKFGIKRKQFFKVTITPSGSIGSYRDKSRYGVLTVHFSNTKLKNIVDTYIADVAQR